MLAELGEVGYARLSMEAVARRAGVGKSALYRRWPGNDAMAAAAIAELSVPAAPRPATLAMTGAEFLAEAVHRSPDDLATAFADYEAQQRPLVDRAQAGVAGNGDVMVPAEPGHAPGRRVVRHPEELVLVPVPARPETEFETAVDEQVDRGRLLGETQRVEQVVVDDQTAHPQIGGGVRGRHQRGERRGDAEVIRHQQRRPTLGLQPTGPVLPRGPGGTPVVVTPKRNGRGVELVMVSLSFECSSVPRSVLDAAARSRPARPAASGARRCAPPAP